MCTTNDIIDWRSYAQKPPILFVLLDAKLVADYQITLVSVPRTALSYPDNVPVVATDNFEVRSK